MPDNPSNPFEGVTDFFSEMGRLRETGTGREGGHEQGERTHASAWVPATDIFARNSDLVIRIEVAGVRPEDVEITFSHGVLTVSGERKTELGAGDQANFMVRERFYGVFRRAINLPEGTDDSQIDAEFDHGLVEITVHGGVRGGDRKRIQLRDRSGGATTRSLG
jgi:HSP20 family protein